MATALQQSRLRWVLALTATFMVVEAVGGWLSGSLALLADAGHMLTDVGALALSLLSAWIAQRPADHTKTYGYLRWEILAALVNGAALFGIAALVVVEAIQRIQEPQRPRACRRGSRTTRRWRPRRRPMAARARSATIAPAHPRAPAGAHWIVPRGGERGSAGQSHQPGRTAFPS